MAGGDGKTRAQYMREKAGEVITGLPAERYKSAAMERGSRMEPEIRSAYGLLIGKEPEIVGFVRRKMRVGFAGCSPDCFVGDDIVTEFKTLNPPALIELLQHPRVPPEHVAQCQGAMLVTGRKFCELVIGYGSMPLFRRMIKRDTSYCARLEVGIETFNQELAKMVTWLRNYRG